MNSRVTIPTTREQEQAFSIWATTMYGNYAAYQAGIATTTDVDEYIRAYLFTDEMITAWIESDSYVRIRSEDEHVKRCKLNRKKLNDKVRYMRTKLGKIAFAEEINQERQSSRVVQYHARTESRNVVQERSIRQIMVELYGEHVLQQVQRLNPNEREQIIRYFERLRQAEIERNHRRVTVQYTKKELTKIVADAPMQDDCCICMDRHTLKTTIQGPCGHIIGKSCFQDWANKCHQNVSCPLCRVNCNEVFEIVESVESSN
jgi:hypothetical protein